MSAVRIVLDTAVLVSRFLNPVPGGAAFDLLQMLRSGNFEIVVSGEILEEVQSALLRKRIRRRYRFEDSDLDEYCEALKQIATVLQPERRIVASRDPGDDMVLDCAVAAGAGYLVTRDEDLLSLKNIEGTEIVTPENLLGLIRMQGKT